MKPTTQRSYRHLGLAVLTWLLAASCPARAHQAPIDIAFWGAFAPDAVRCQRILSRAAAQCATTSWLLIRDCGAQQMAGEECDVVATRAAANHAHAVAVAVAERACVGVDLTPLGFLSLLDIDVDVDTLCQQVENAMVSAVYLPATHAGVITTTDAATRGCIEVASRAATRLLRFGFRERRHLLDRIAATTAGPAAKIAAIKASTVRLQRAQALSDMRLRALCPDFAARYGRGSAAFLKLVSQRADCLGGRTYAQNGVTCPLPVCGNGMREASEDCDDGNLVDGDGCDQTCTVEEQP